MEEVDCGFVEPPQVNYDTLIGKHIKGFEEVYQKCKKFSDPISMETLVELMEDNMPILFIDLLNENRNYESHLTSIALYKHFENDRENLLGFFLSQ